MYICISICICIYIYVYVYNGFRVAFSFLGLEFILRFIGLIQVGFISVVYGKCSLTDE